MSKFDFYYPLCDHRMGAHREGGGASVSGRPLLFHHMGVFLLRFSRYGGPFSPSEGSVCSFFLYGGGLFWAFFPPIRKFLRAPIDHVDRIWV